MISSSRNAVSETMRQTIKKNILRIILALIVIQFPLIGYSESGSGWFKSLFEQKGKNMNELTITREVIIKDKSGLPEPHVISRASDGGFVIAGSLGKAWAIKTDVTGKLLWRVLSDKPLAEGGHTSAFTGAVSMPDGSTYLCGYTELPPGGYTPSILTYLNLDGKILDEQLFLPSVRTERGLSYFDDCVRWGDNLLVMGHIYQSNNNEDWRKRGEAYYWILMLDSAGKVKWEKQLPTKFNVIDRVSALTTTDKSMVFIGHRNLNTELLRISTTGELINKKYFENSFTFVKPVVPDGVLQFYGYNPADRIYTLLTLDENFEETHRVLSSKEFDFSGYVYRMPDKSMIVFGGESQPGSKSAVAHVDAKLQSLQKIELLQDKRFFDNGLIQAVTSTGKTGEFITVRKLMKHAHIKELLNTSNRERVSIALDFIQIKNVNKKE